MSPEVPTVAMTKCRSLPISSCSSISPPHLADTSLHGCDLVQIEIAVIALHIDRGPVPEQHHGCRSRFQDLVVHAQRFDPGANRILAVPRGDFVGGRELPRRHLVGCSGYIAASFWFARSG